MAGNTFGKLYRLTSFGESHGASIGGVIDGCPAGIELDFDQIQHQLNRRKPGQSKIVTQRREDDEVVFHSGIFEGKTTGTPIGFAVYNTNQKGKDYDHIAEAYRPSHADYTYDQKYGFRDYRGGGRSSARETIARVVAGAIAMQVLKRDGIHVCSFVKSVGDINLDKHYSELDLEEIDSNIVRCPDSNTAEKMIDFITSVKKNGDTVGGVITGVIKNCPIGLGEPVFDKFHAILGMAMLGINAVKAFEYGEGFEGTKALGSQQNDLFEANSDGKISIRTNHSGGIQGGITNGQDIYFNVGFKPVATIMQVQASVNKAGENIELLAKGRHDPCVLPRAVPIVDAMSALVTLDFLLQQKAYNSKL